MDLAVLKFDMTGATVASKYWHTTSPAVADKAGAIYVKDNGQVIVVGGRETDPNTGYSAYWDYDLSLNLTGGYPKNLASHPTLRAITNIGPSVYTVNNGSPTVVQLTGAGTPITGAEGIEGQGVGAPVFTFGGAYNSAGGNTIAGAPYNSIGRQVFVDTVTASGPFVYVAFISTTASLGGELYPEVDSVARLDASGNLLSSATIPGNSAGADAFAVDAFFNIYVSYKVKTTSTTTTDVGIVKFNKFLAQAGQVSYQSPTSGGPAYTNATRMTTDGTNIFVHNDGSSLIKFNSSLVALATASYTTLPGFTNGNGITIDPSGNTYMVVNNATSTLHLLKYGPAFDAASPLVDVDVSTVLLPIIGNGGSIELAYAGGGVFAMVGSVDGSEIYIRKFDSSLNYTGVSSTFSPTRLEIGPGQLQAGPDGYLYVVTAASTPTGSQYAAAKYDVGLNLISTAAFNPSGNGGSAVGLHVPTAGDVWVTGTSCNGGGGNSCTVRTTRLTLSGGGGPVVPATLSYSGTLPAGAA
ncbi:MAG: hypothetical protein HYV15_06450, partial [Elusimicrobia bacterium]|nr:hypothetical protein [Elusimicrobiota bacterium]